MTDTTETITQMTDQCEKARDLKYVDWRVFQGLKCKSKMHIYFIVWPYVSINEKDQRRLLKAKEITGKMLVRYL